MRIQRELKLLFTQKDKGLLLISKEFFLGKMAVGWTAAKWIRLLYGKNPKVFYKLKEVSGIADQ